MRPLMLPLMLALLATGCDRAPQPPAPGSGGSGSSKPAQKAGAVAYDPHKAQQEINELQTRLQTAMEQGSSLAPVLADTQRYVEKYPDVVAGRVLLGQVSLLNADFDRAIEQFERALQIDPRQPEIHLSAGSVALQRGDLDRAEKHFTQAVSLDTASARYRVHLADVYKQRAQYDKAQTTLLEALRLDSTSHRAHALLSEVFARQNKLGMAIEQCDRAIALAKNEPRHQPLYLRTKAKLQLRANRPDEALRTLGTLPPAMQVELDVSRQMAECWAMLGEPGRAATHFEQVTIIDPTNVDAMAEAARWMIRAQRPADARAMLDRLRALRPTHPALTELEPQLAS